VLWHWAGGGLPLPQAKAPLTVARPVILFGPEPWRWGSGTVAAGWGVVGMGGCIAGCAHPLEESATNFRNASIHLLPFWQYILRSELPLSRFPRNRVNRIYSTPLSYKDRTLDLDATEVEEVPASGRGQQLKARSPHRFLQVLSTLPPFSCLRDKEQPEGL
jgi:hypothetical protein